MDNYILNCGLEVEKKWTEYLGLTSLADLNEQNRKGNMKEIMQICEAMHDKRIVDIADIIEKSRKRIILLAGPSSSGKTTSAKKLCIQLRAIGIHPVYLGVDDYYKERDEIPVGPDGLKDFESLSAIDTDLFNEQMNDLLAGKHVQIPSFNFITGKKEFGERTVHMKDNQPIIIEGILCLRPELTPDLPDYQKFRIYTCPLSSLKLDDGSRLNRTDIRKLRRLIRDHAKRGWGLEETFAMWPKIREGEENNIFPFSKTADVVFNSAQPYELAVIKDIAMPILKDAKQDSQFYKEAQRLISILEQVDSVENYSYIEGDSVIREFIGGGEL